MSVPILWPCIFMCFRVFAHFYVFSSISFRVCKLDSLSLWIGSVLGMVWVEASWVHMVDSCLLWVATSCYDISCTVILLFGNNVMLMWCTLGSYFADTEVSKKCGVSTTVSSASWRGCFAAFSACRSVNSFDYKLEVEPGPVYVYRCA